jgi:hypothetical protein
MEFASKIWKRAYPGGFHCFWASPNDMDDSSVNSFQFSVFSDDSPKLKTEN